MSENNRGWTKGPDSHELYVEAMEAKAENWKPYLEERGSNGMVFCTLCKHYNSPGLGGWNPMVGDDCMYCNGKAPNNAPSSNQ